jgi:hypothetical protein
VEVGHGRAEPADSLVRPDRDGWIAREDVVDLEAPIAVIDEEPEGSRPDRLEPADRFSITVPTPPIRLRGISFVISTTSNVLSLVFEIM